MKLLPEHQSYPESRWSLDSVQVWNSDSIIENADLVCESNRIVEIRKKPGVARCALIPAGVDAQVHLRVPGQSDKETAETGMLAALYGGVGAVLSMPNTKPVIDSVEILKEAQSIVRGAEEELGLEVYFAPAVTMGQKGLELAKLEELAGAGAKAFTDDGLGVESDEIMREAFKVLESLDLPLLQHAEFSGHGGVLAPGPVQEKLGVKAYSSDPEDKMVERDLRVLEDYPKARYHVLHISSRKVPSLLEAARQKSLRVTGEVSPHHLYFSSDQIDPENTAFKMNPPIRSSEDKRALRKALADGTIDFCATDHAPHTADQKGSDFSKSMFGTLGLETFLPVLLEMYREGELTRERLVEVFSQKPAEFLGLQKTYGRIEEGTDIRAVLVDLENSPTAQVPENIHSKSKNTCFSGQPLIGDINLHFTKSGIFRLYTSAETPSIRAH